MKSSLKAVVLAALVVSVLLLSACPKRVSIGDIEANPGRYFDKDVAIAGTVTNSYGVSIPLAGEGGGIYKVDDGTGTIWVITKRSVPAKNAQLGVKGKIQNGVTFGGKNYGLVLIEDDRRFKKN
ncbi:MAG: hypothetical protein R2684_06725 [Pyrinomonadaceae bacterium]